VAGIVPGGLPRWRSDAADPTGTCSRRSVDPRIDARYHIQWLVFIVFAW
jgi:hypothetical protein